MAVCPSKSFPSADRRLRTYSRALRLPLTLAITVSLPSPSTLSMGLIFSAVPTMASTAEMAAAPFEVVEIVHGEPMGHTGAVLHHPGSQRLQGQALQPFLRRVVNQQALADGGAQGVDDDYRRPGYFSSSCPAISMALFTVPAQAEENAIYRIS